MTEEVKNTVILETWVLHYFSSPIFQWELVEKCLASEVISESDISNYDSYVSDVFLEYDSEGEEEEERKESIYDWIVFPRMPGILIEELSEKGHPVLTNTYGTWVGRTDKSYWNLDEVFIPYAVSKIHGINFTEADVKEMRKNEHTENFSMEFEIIN